MLLAQDQEIVATVIATKSVGPTHSLATGLTVRSMVTGELMRTIVARLRQARQQRAARRLRLALLQAWLQAHQPQPRPNLVLDPQAAQHLHHAERLTTQEGVLTNAPHPEDLAFLADSRKQEPD